jgi:ferritin-like metal-binding protein YciE
MEKASDLRAEKAAKELNTLIKSFSAKGLSFRKFNRVADIHGICVNHNIVDNQLVNLWTALETLTPSHAASSKIANITAAAIPFLMHIYVGQLVQQLTYDLLNWDKWRAKKILHKVPCEPRTSLRGKCLRLLCLPENEPLRDQLYEHLKDFHLLRYRAFRLSESLSDRQKLRDLLDSHEKKVSWQIRRIYRTRNLLVHSGRTPPAYIETLVENGHEYLDSMIYEVMKTSCGAYGATSLEQVFEIAKIRYKEFMRKVADDSVLTNATCDFLLGQQDALPLAEA